MRPRNSDPADHAMTIHDIPNRCWPTSLPVLGALVAQR
jgi:hypothetical protein